MKRVPLLYEWNLMIKNAEYKRSLTLYTSMFNSSIHGDNYTYPLLFKSCSKLNYPRHGSLLHTHTFLLGYDTHVVVRTALIDMYSHLHDHLRCSRQLFDEMSERTLVTWNTMIAAYCRHLGVHDSFMLLKQMIFDNGVHLSEATFIGVVSVCDDIKLALCLHCYVSKTGLDLDMGLSNAVMRMYTRFGLMDQARVVFDVMGDRSVVSWTTLIGGYVRVDNVVEALVMFSVMRRLHQRVSLDIVVFVNIVSGCVKLANHFLAMSIHSLVLKCGFDDQNPIDNLLVNMYAKCRDLLSARRMFDTLDDKSVFLWTSMIGAYAHLGFPSQAFNLFKRMLRTNVAPNGVTLATVLSACADMGSLSTGEEIEKYILHKGLDSDLQVQTSLIHMYCKCGSIEKARNVFEKVSNKDLAVWSSMINGCAVHGMGEEALNLFKKMQTQDKMVPDAGVYTSVMLACSHSGLVEHGLKYFKSMQTKYGIEPGMEHYSCLVDLLSRVGYFDLALKAIEEMPIQVKPKVWAPLLSACTTHQNYELGEFAAKKLLELDPKSSNYVTLANLYTSVGKYKEAALARELINTRGGLPKECGWTQI